MVVLAEMRLFPAANDPEGEGLWYGLEPAALEIFTFLLDLGMVVSKRELFEALRQPKCWGLMIDDSFLLRFVLSGCAVPVDGQKTIGRSGGGTKFVCSYFKSQIRISKVTSQI